VGLRVFVFGAGKAGASLARALRAAGIDTQLRAARSGLPRAIDADVVVLAVRDRDLEPLAVRLRDAGLVPKQAVVVHVAGALGPEPLAALRGSCAGVAQMHPMISFASDASRAAPDLSRGNVHVQGDPRAVSRARRLARILGMTPRTIAGLDPIAYHAAAGLVANGAGGPPPRRRAEDARAAPSQRGRERRAPRAPRGADRSGSPGRRGGPREAPRHASRAAP